MLSGIPKHKSSGKSNLSGGLIYYSNRYDLLDRLKLLVGTRRAGNNNLALRNEIWQIIDTVLEKKYIKISEYDNFVNKLLM